MQPASLLDQLGGGSACRRLSGGAIAPSRAATELSLSMKAGATDSWNVDLPPAHAKTQQGLGHRVRAHRERSRPRRTIECDLQSATQNESQSISKLRWAVIGARAACSR